MKPDQNNINTNNSPLRNGQNQPSNHLQQAAAADLVRSQINTIYNRDPNAAAIIPERTKQPEATQLNPPYNRTHEEPVDPQADQWKQYHSAWQTYYQKYYEGYYTHHLQKAQQAIQAHNVTTAAQTASDGYFSENIQTNPQPEQETLSKDEALYDLRSSLLSKVRSSAGKVRKSRHFVPIAAGVVVMLIFAFLQYNQLLIANVMAYVSPGNIDPQNIVVDPTTNVNVGPQPLLIIPKINVDVPVSYDIGNDYNSQMAAMANGLAWFGIPGAASHPGQIGNTVLAGHSSNDLLDKGSYKFIFAQLDNLETGDTIYANYNSIRYTYVVTGKKVVAPTDVSALVYATDKPILTLLTCTPLGTATNRLLVTAEQVSPAVSTASAQPATSSTSATTSIPGSGSTVFEKLFGAKG